ncbi:hypothetical protein TELCIR_03504 [Teladorsagia circumcincta]|uniref:Uncharacterized protein n=1 Tax=Teladorsagia circumcincta TaxID=45464 RepID=A0A2G9UW60_TELCI|nr:hypothetical protein TELCIR_03504 [Teladorsagia circumcincta]
MIACCRSFTSIDLCVAFVALQDYSIVKTRLLMKICCKALIILRISLVSEDLRRLHNLRFKCVIVMQ